MFEYDKQNFKSERLRRLCTFRPVVLTEPLLEVPTDTEMREPDPLEDEVVPNSQEQKDPPDEP